MPQSVEQPDISELIRLGKVKKTHFPILLYLAEQGGRARFHEIYQYLGKGRELNKSTLKNRLDVLSSLGVITYSEGLAELRSKATLCFIVGCSKIPYTYVGLLGKRVDDTNIESETETAIKLLKEEGIELNKIQVVTTPEALESWKESIRYEVWKRI